jgi:hypothetical protein
MKEECEELIEHYDDQLKHYKATLNKLYRPFPQLANEKKIIPGTQLPQQPDYTPTANAQNYTNQPGFGQSFGERNSAQNMYNEELNNSPNKISYNDPRGTQ